MGTHNPFFSVVVTCRNAEAFIGACMQSVKDQAFVNFECLIMDDCSDDRTFDVARAAIGEDDRFAVWKNQERRLVPSTTRQLIELARGEIVVWIGGDDQFANADALSRIALAYGTDPQVDATYGSFQRIALVHGTDPQVDASHGSFQAIPSRRRWPRDLPKAHPWWEGWCFSHVLTFRRELSLQSFLEEWKTQAYQDSNGSPYRTAGDVAIYYGVVARARRVAFIPEIIYDYRLHPGNDCAIDRQGQKAAEQRICRYWKERMVDGKQ